MEFLHTEIVTKPGQVVQVTLSGTAANVLLLDGPSFEAYKAGGDYVQAAGGYFNASPVVIRPPKPGPWHLVVDLAGLPGEVVASVSLRPDDSG